MDGLKEIVQEGWLIKSPPTKLWKARWRQRWFSLRHSGELPGQYFLEYYVDRQCRKLKGKIDLDQCEQVDAGLTLINRKEKYHFMFNVKTPKRIYYLVADTEADMNKWVDTICQVCSLKAYTQDEDQQCEMYPFDAQESPPVSPNSIMSGPYIPISECISGPRLNDTSSLSSMSAQSVHNYDVRKIVPSPPRSPTTDADSTITDDESLPSLPSVNWDTFPSAGDLKPVYRTNNSHISSWNVTKRFSKMKISDSNKASESQNICIPPRPPKFSNAAGESPGHNYFNLDGATESSKPNTPSTPAQSASNNDLSTVNSLPRSRSIAAVKHQVTAPKIEDNVFLYDFDHNDNAGYASTAEIHKDSAKNSVEAPPPLVFRELKPGKKTSGSNEVKDMKAGDNSEPPSINRKLKPQIIKSPEEDSSHLLLPPGKGKLKSNPSPILISKKHRVSEEDKVFEEKEEIYFYQDNDQFTPASNRHLLVLQYLDLDLDAADNANNCSPGTQPTSINTVYKTVDFLKTDAFNRTRQRVEEERKQCTNDFS